MDPEDGSDRLATAIFDANRCKALLDDICLRSFGDIADMAKTRVRDIVVAGFYHVDQSGTMTCRIRVPYGEEDVVHDVDALARLESELVLLVSEQGGGQDDELRLYPKRQDASSMPVPVFALKQFHVETFGTLRMFSEARQELARAGYPMGGRRRRYRTTTTPSSVPWHFSDAERELWSDCCRQSTWSLQVIRNSLQSVVEETATIRERNHQWKRYVATQRLQAYALNFYTMEQV